MNPHSALLRSRARGDQIYRKDIPRPLPTDPNVILSSKITQLLTKSREYEAEKRITQALRLTQKALELAKSLPTQEETSRVDYITKRERDLRRLVGKKERRLFRSYAPTALSQASPA